MGEDCEMLRPQHNFDWQSPKLNSLTIPLTLGHQNSIPACMNPRTNMVSASGNFPLYALSGISHPRAGPISESHGWFYCLPRFRQAFTPASNSILKEKIPARPNGTNLDAVLPNAWSGSAQKRFLVFDQSGDQTTLMFSPGIATPQGQALLTPKPLSGSYLNGDVTRTISDLNPHSGPNLTDEFNENHETDDQSEMHEDTEELNALLYSDDDDENDYSEGDEVTSTGHSPSTMTAHNKSNWFEEGTEEVASCAGPTKKRKLFNKGCDDMASLMDTASSVNPNRFLEYEDDAESSCANGKNAESGSTSRNKRMRKERILETVRILQSIIPDVKGKGPIVVIDEAIHYLKALKLKAEDLGLGSL